MKTNKYTPHLLKKLKHIHDEMREATAIYQFLNPHLDVSAWASDELDCWGVFRCSKCDCVLPNEYKTDMSKCLECTKPFLNTERDEYETN